MPFVYILRCSDRTLYVGHTDNLSQRERTHNNGLGAKYTATRLPVELIYSEQVESIAGAVRRERQLKRWSGRKKESAFSFTRVFVRTVERRSAEGLLRSARD